MCERLIMNENWINYPFAKCAWCGHVWQRFDDGLPDLDIEVVCPKCEQTSVLTQRELSAELYLERLKRNE